MAVSASCSAGAGSAVFVAAAWRSKKSAMIAWTSRRCAA
jgi:hypothetical protein